MQMVQQKPQEHFLTIISSLHLKDSRIFHLIWHITMKKQTVVIQTMMKWRCTSQMTCKTSQLIKSAKTCQMIIIQHLASKPQILLLILMNKSQILYMTKTHSFNSTTPKIKLTIVKKMYSILRIRVNFSIEEHSNACMQLYSLPHAPFLVKNQKIFYQSMYMFYI